MVLKNKRIGVAMTGSFCTYTKAFEQIDRPAYQMQVWKR